MRTADKERNEALLPQIIELYRKGLGCHRIGRILGISKTTVRDILPDKMVRRHLCRNPDIQPSRSNPEPSQPEPSPIPLTVPPPCMNRRSLRYSEPATDRASGYVMRMMPGGKIVTGECVTAYED